MFPSVTEGKNKFSVKVQNPQLPKLYSLPKIHILENSIRPIYAPISKNFFIIPKIRKIVNKKLYNTGEKLLDIEIKKDKRLISFDVVTLFPSVFQST